MNSPATSPPASRVRDSGPTTGPTATIEAVLNSSFDFEGPKEPMVFATENDVLNGIGMLFMELLTNRAQIFADVRTYWSPEATKRVTGYDLEGKAKENGGIIHLLNSGAACLDACGECTDENGNAVMKRWWEVGDADIQKMTDATVWCEAGFDNFRGGGFSSHFVTRAEMPATMIRLNLVKGLGPVLQIAEGWTVKLPDEVTDTLMERTNPTWPCTWFTRAATASPAARLSAYSVMQNWGREPRRDLPTATSARTSSRSARCCASPSACTTSPIRTSSVRPHGTHSAWIRRPGLPRLRRLRPDVQEYPLSLSTGQALVCPTFLERRCEMMRNLLAFDLGASNGRAILGQFDGEKITMRELHRFENNYIEMNGVFYWDLPYLYSQLKQGLLAFKNANVGELDCIGIDTWGVDYGLLDKNGHLLSNPRSYRYAVDADMEAVWKTVDFPTLFARTGIATMNFNTVYQLYRRQGRTTRRLQTRRRFCSCPIFWATS